MTSRNGDVGITKYYNGKFEVSDHTFALTGFDNTKYSVGFFYQWMKNNYDYIHSLAHGTGIPGINTKDLGSIEVNVPNLTEQKRISKVLSDYDELTSTLDTEIEVLKNTKNQLMNNIFN